MTGVVCTNVLLIVVLQFHQTLKTYLNDRVWDFYFYVSKTWPETRVCVHFPGMTSSVSDLHVLIPSTALLFMCF